MSLKSHNCFYYYCLPPLQAQVAVKDSKLRFDKLKNDLSEKIDMVFASRCNLLSRSLPFYQKELLSFCDKSANAFHKILVDLRSHHHHQYKVKRLLEEIRDLESEETPLAPEMQLPADDDDEPLLDIGADVFGDAYLTSQSPTLEGESTVQGEGVFPQRESDPFSFEKILEEAGVSDLLLGGSEATIQSLQSELKQPNTTANVEDTRPLNPETAQPTTEEPSLDEIDNLLNFEETVDKTQTEQTKEELLDEWGSFSAFMSSPQKEADNTHSGWEKELTTSKQDSGTPDLPVGTIPQQPTSKDKVASTSELNISPLLGEDRLSHLLSDDLKLLGLDSLEPTKQGQLSSGLESLDPLMFQASQPPMPTTAPSSQPPLMPQPPSVFKSPMNGSQMPILPPTYLRQGEATKGTIMKGAASPKKAVKKDDGKGSAWMNVFAHLDPLANEKA